MRGPGRSNAPRLPDSPATSWPRGHTFPITAHLSSDVEKMWEKRAGTPPGRRGCHPRAAPPTGNATNSIPAVPGHAESGAECDPRRSGVTVWSSRDGGAIRGSRSP